MFERYAVYFTASGEFAQRGAAWLGWDVATGCAVAQPDLPSLDLPELTEKPRKYGFHATIKPPFVLTDGMTQAALETRLKNVCAQLNGVMLKELEVVALGRFLALVPQGETTALTSLAGDVVALLDTFRAPMSEEEFERRNQSHLSGAQFENLCKWGYPHVMDQFRFHMTLTGRISKPDLASVQTAVKDHFATHIQTPTNIDSLTLVGQGADGYFVEIARFPLGVAGL
ncbi:MAG: DUF1045 domain-containing protein [Sulfitobacter sp.]